MDKVELQARGPGGEALGTIPLEGEALRQAVAADGILRVHAPPRAVLEAKLLAAGTDVVIWWIEGSAGGKPVFRTPWQAVNVVASS